MEDQSEHDFKQVSIGTKLVQLKPIELVQPRHVYIFLKTSIAYVQHESL
jgi:hypothetical protein